MSERLPSLTALRAFEAAARHMSFSDAADELAVTPAALSYQIKNLEEQVGTPLFRRLNRAVELTQAGRDLQPGVASAFTTLQQSWSALRRTLDHSSLTVTAGPGFTAKWLAPRLFRFAQANPDIDLRFSATLRMMDFTRDEFDCAIRFGLGDDEGLFSRDILTDWMTPMLHPSLAKPNMAPSDLLDLPLIHDDSPGFSDPKPGWQPWFKAVGIDHNDTHGLRFSQGDHAIDLAQEAGGVVLGRISMAERALNDGRLVAPFPTALRTRAHYRFVCPLGHEERPNIARFLQWVLEEIKALDQFTEGREFIESW